MLQSFGRSPSKHVCSANMIFFNGVRAGFPLKYCLPILIKDEAILGGVAASKRALGRRPLFLDGLTEVKRQQCPGDAQILRKFST